MRKRYAYLLRYQLANYLQPSQPLGLLHSLRIGGLGTQPLWYIVSSYTVLFRYLSATRRHFSSTQWRKTPHNSHVRTSYWVPFVSLDSGKSVSFVFAMHISAYIITRYIELMRNWFVMGLMQQATHPMCYYVRGGLRKQATFTHSTENSVILDGSGYICTSLTCYTHLYVLIHTYGLDETS